MFQTLLLATFGTAVVSAYAVIRAFSPTTRVVLQHVVGRDLSELWHRYLRFAVMVTGVSCGAPVWTIEKYITPPSNDAEIVALNAQRWTLEIYRAVINTLEGTASALFVFFLFAVVLHVWLRRAGQSYPAASGGVAVANH